MLTYECLSILLQCDIHIAGFVKEGFFNPIGCVPIEFNGPIDADIVFMGGIVAHSHHIVIDIVI